MMTALIRFADENDTEDLLDIYRPYIIQTAITFEYEIPDTSSFKKRLEAIHRQFPWLVLEIDKKLAGYAYASPHHERAAYQWGADMSIYLAEGYQGMGIGKALYFALIELLRKQGYYNLYALLVSPNEKSERLHTYFGFETIGMYKNTGNKFGKWYDVRCMEKVIKKHDENPHEPIPVLKIKQEEIEGIFIKSMKFLKPGATN